MRNVFIILRNVFTYLYHFKFCKFDLPFSKLLRVRYKISPEISLSAQYI